MPVIVEKHVYWFGLLVLAIVLEIRHNRSLTAICRLHRARDNGNDMLTSGNPISCIVSYMAVTEGSQVDAGCAGGLVSGLS